MNNQQENLLDSNEKRRKFLDEQVNNLAEAQETNLVIDFDQAIKEKAEKEIEIIFMKQVFKIPSSMPSDFALFFFRNIYDKKKKTIDVPEHLIFEFIEKIFGKEFIKVLSTSKVSINTVFDTLALKVMGIWGYATKSQASKKK